MAKETKSPMTLVAGEALEAFRRVKLDASGNVIYSDAGEAYLGFTKLKVASGEQVTVELKNEAKSFKMVAADSFAINAALYGAADGKVSDTAVGNQIGTAIEAAGADLDVVEALADLGAGAQINGASTLIADLTAEGAVPVVFAKQGVTDATTSVDIVASAAFKFRVIFWWIIARNTTAANIKLVNGSTDMTAVKAKGTTNDAIVVGGDVIAAQKDVAAAGALKVNASAAAAFDIFVVAVKVS